MSREKERREALEALDTLYRKDGDSFELARARRTIERYLDAPAIPDADENPKGFSVPEGYVLVDRVEMREQLVIMSAHYENLHSESVADAYDHAIELLDAHTLPTEDDK